MSQHVSPRAGWLAVLSLMLGASGVAAQESFKSDPLDPAFVMPDPSKYDKSDRAQKAEYSSLERTVKGARKSTEDAAESAIRGLADLNSVRAEFDRYFNQLIFPQMTHTDDESLHELGARREALLKYVRTSGNDSPVRKHLIEDLILPNFSRIAGDAGYHPAVRLNAVLILGNVNRREGQRNVEPALPSEVALRALVDIANAADNPDFLKIGALSGILRHATIDGQLQSPVLDNALRERCIDLAISILGATAPAADTELSDEQYWMRRQAVQILGAFRRPGANGKVVTALRTVLNENDSRLMLAADAVEAYGNIRFESAQQADVANVVTVIGNTVNRFLQADLRAMDEYVGLIKDKRLIDKKSSETGGAVTAGDETEDFGGAGGVGGKGRPRGGTDGGSASASPSAPVTIPNYKINDIRQRSKFIAFVARRTLDGMPPRRRNEVKQPEALKALADPATAKVIDGIVAALDQLMADTDLPPVTPTANSSEFLTGDQPKPPPTLDERLRLSLRKGMGAIETAIATDPADQQPGVKAAVGG